MRVAVPRQARTREAIGGASGAVSRESGFSIIALDKFIQATRDSGYKGTPSALSELVDNSIQAGATRIAITVRAAGDARVCAGNAWSCGCGLRAADRGDQRFGERVHDGRGQRARGSGTRRRVAALIGVRRHARWIRRHEAVHARGGAGRRRVPGVGQVEHAMDGRGECRAICAGGLKYRSAFAASRRPARCNGTCSRIEVSTSNSGRSSGVAKLMPPVATSGTRYASARQTSASLSSS